MTDPIVTVELKKMPIVLALANDVRVRRVFDREFRRAGKRVGKKLQRDMRAVIRSGQLPANSGFTIELKGSAKPLAGPGGRLFKSITSTVEGGVGDLAIIVGVMRTSEQANVARIVHDGTRPFTVTPRMAAMFRAISSATLGKAVSLRSERAKQIMDHTPGPFRPLRVGTTLQIPPRPFAKVVLEASTTGDLVLGEFREAILRAMRALSK